MLPLSLKEQYGVVVKVLDFGANVLSSNHLAGHEWNFNFFDVALIKKVFKLLEVSLKMSLV